MRLCMIDGEGGQGCWDTGVVLRYCGIAVELFGGKLGGCWSGG